MSGKAKVTGRVNFTDKENAAARKLYLKILAGGCFSVILAVFAFFSMYWGALWKSPVRNLPGWVIDFDGGLVGQNVAQALTSPQLSKLGKVTWSPVPASQFPGGLQDLVGQVREHKTWVAIAIHEGATQRLQASYASPNASYDPTSALTVYGVEARNENAYRSLIRPSAEAALQQIIQKFAIQATHQLLASNTNVTSILQTSPQTVLTPIAYTLDNLIPFDVPVATAITFVGLLYQLILAFFVVMIGAGARDAAGLGQKLTTKSLIYVRLASSFVAYFVLALFYALLSLAFQVDFSRKFGHGGFVLFWMLNWVGMLSVGLALESLITLLTIRFMPFFMILWIIANVSVCIFPIEVLPVVFRYGYVAPFYNVSKAVRTIVFGTKNQLGTNFAILIVWIAISCISLPLIQWFVRRSEDRQAAAAPQSEPTPSTESHATQAGAAVLEKDLARDV